MAEFFNSLLGVNAVLDSAEEILDLPGADFGSGELNRFRISQTALWMRQPFPRGRGTPKHLGRSLHQLLVANELFRFVASDFPLDFPPVKRRAGHSEESRNLFQRQIERVLQVLDAPKAQARLNPPNLLLDRAHARRLP